MDPFIGGALISGATSLLGGLFGRKQAKDDLAMQRQLINEQNEYNNPTNIRKRAEDAGFNPLSFIGPGVGLQTQTAQVNSGNYMGAAIADAGMAMADAMSKKAELGRLDKLSQANAKLQAKVQSLTLRPKVGGVYAQRQETPSLRAALGGGNATTVGSGSVVVASDDAGGNRASGGDQLTPPPMRQENLYVEVFDPDTGRKIRVPNPDLLEAGVIDTATGMALMGYYDVKQNVAPTVHSGVTLGFSEAARKFNAGRGSWGSGYQKAPSPSKPKSPAYINPRWNSSQRPMFGGGF